MVRRVLGTTAAGGGVLGTVLAAGWVGAVVLIGVVLVLIGALCWVIADPERPPRLALLLAAWRMPTRTDNPAALTRRRTRG